MELEDGEARFEMEILAKPLGFTTLALVLVTATLGLQMYRGKGVFYKWHKRFAFTAIAVAICHGIVVFLTS